MFSVRKIFAAVIVLAAFFFLCGCKETAAAGFDPKGYVVDDGLLYTVNSKGQKKQFEDAEVVEEETEGGIFYWLAVDPENDELYEGWQGGIYFFGEDGKFISRLECEGAQRSYVQFNPDGRKFILGSGTYVEHVYELYEFEGLELQKTFYGAGLEWIDPYRLAFTFIDTSQKARHESADLSGWLSVVVYDSAVDLLTVVAEATKTEDFMLDGFDEESGELTITKFSVKDEKDWADEEKREIEDISRPLPAAG